MKALIIEDELPSARRIERFLNNFEIEVLTTLTSVKKSIKWLESNSHPDIIFMDIHLSDGLCFEIFDAINVDSKIVFTTAYSNYSIKAFDYDSISYLLKPINEEQLKKAIEKAKDHCQQAKDLEQFKELITNYKVQKYKNSFAVKVGTKIKMISTEKIDCFYSFENATYIKTEGSNYIINHSLTTLEIQLDPEQFFRVNRTYMVHINAVKDIVAYTNSRLKLVLHSYLEEEIIVSRERVKDFKSWIDR